MKKINKLLPIGIIASAASIVVPISVSCGSNTGAGQANLRDIYNNGYTRTTDVLSASTQMLEKEATKYYLQGVKEHPEIVSDDLFEQFHIESQLDKQGNEGSREGPIVSETNAVVKISNVSANPDKGTISLKASFDGIEPMYLRHESKMQNAGGQIQRVDVVGHYELEVKDFAIVLLYDGDYYRIGRNIYNIWNVYADYKPVGGGSVHLPNNGGSHMGSKELTEDKDWSVSINYDFTYNWADGAIEKETRNGKFNYQSPEALLEWLSYYFEEEADYYHALYLQKIIPTDSK